MSTYEAIKQEGKIEVRLKEKSKSFKPSCNKIPPIQIVKYTKLSEYQVFDILKNNGINDLYSIKSPIIFNN